MGGRFWYVFLSVALVAAGLAAGVATWLEWLPCQGSMLNGSVLVGGQYLNDFSDACLARMDGSDALPLAPGVLWARGLSALLLAVGWLGFASRLRLTPVQRLVVLLPVVSVGWYAVATWLAPALGNRSLWDVTGPASIATELTAFVAFIVIDLKLGGARARLPSLIGLWAVAAYGIMHLIIDYLVMAATSDANWDAPPGTGYLTAAMMVLCGVLVAVLGWRAGRAGATSVRSGDPVLAGVATPAD
ncbi:MAG: hypothetical protein VB093_07490 [Propionicimonas sp.]|nr:hypothetical protein [Propionicimonas sp.]